MSRQITRRQPAKLNSNIESQELVPAAAWLNIGYESDQGFIPLQGAGVPIERLKEIRATDNSSDEWRFLVEGNARLQALVQEKLGSLQPGEGVVLKLCVELRRPAEKSDSASSMFDMSNIEI